MFLKYVHCGDILNTLRYDTAFLKVTMFPAVKKHLSELTDVAEIAKYWFVNHARAGYLFSLDFHHSYNTVNNYF